MPIATKNLKINSSVKHYALYRTFERALDNCPGFKIGGPGIVALVVPSGRTAEDFKACAVAFLYDGVDQDAWDHIGYACIGAAAKQEWIKSEFAERCGKRRRVLLITETSNLPPLVAVSVDTFIDVAPVDEFDLKEACAKVLKVRISLKQAHQLLTFPSDLMFAALRPNSSAADTIRRLGSISTPIADARPIKERTLRLEELHGYGAAKEWGLQLAKDLEAWRSGNLKWSDVDRGLLLSGPPGVGKTIFARALADTCGVNFVATSVVQWQAKGHLGDLLKAMRADFASAVDKAPSILLLDELDSIGDRKTFTGEYASYSIQVVNALLEALDGSANRDGLVVVGATNYPEKIDAAIRRPGRLDRHVAIGLPNEADRLAMIGQMLGEHEVADISSLGPLTESMAGADLARMVRDAKKKARREQRSLSLADLTSLLPDLIKIDGQYRYAVAVHEVGHALVGKALNIGYFFSVDLANQINPRLELQSYGQAVFGIPRVLIRNAQRYRDEICFRLAGMAAEQVIFGYHTDGAGLGATSDLATATGLAVQMETQFGMGSGLHHLGGGMTRGHIDLAAAPWLVGKVDAVLREELIRATAMLSERREIILTLSKELDLVGSIVADRFDEICKEAEPSGKAVGDEEKGGQRGQAAPVDENPTLFPKEARR
ncbi:AAA family ATPase [Rhizobium leguminosarum]|uniref:AAA family ATPase n=1 Tax=Rhizobium leguminosarum TaxID=384 RepID=UPI00143F6E97|nr:AAA family ATPase [Rhizobium leguminosarum]NKL23697.1 AAA family ATPase [Rhizobium leguminosarum bv. viciae]